jgi:hypothetical protein
MIMIMIVQILYVGFVKLNMEHVINAMVKIAILPFTSHVHYKRF